MQAIERMKAALELARASGSSAVPMNPEIVSEVLAHIDALETKTDVQTLRIVDPARVGDEAQAQTFGVLA